MLYYQKIIPKKYTLKLCSLKKLLYTQKNIKLNYTIKNIIIIENSFEGKYGLKIRVGFFKIQSHIFI